jgi:hypothetical protein
LICAGGRRKSVKATHKSAAIVTIHDASGMTAKGRRQIAAWLRRQADFVEKDGKALASRFTARYLYRVAA